MLVKIIGVSVRTERLKSQILTFDLILHSQHAIQKIANKTDLIS
jgi:hypothetical protein